MRIALLFNEKTAPPSGAPDDIFEEYDSLETVGHISAALRGLSAEVDLVPADRRLPWRLEQTRYDFAFNIAEGPVGLAGRAPTTKAPVVFGRDFCSYCKTANGRWVVAPVLLWRIRTVSFRQSTSSRRSAVISPPVRHRSKAV